MAAGKHVLGIRAEPVSPSVLGQQMDLLHQSHHPAQSGGVLSEDQADRFQRNMEYARNVVSAFVNDPTMAHAYHEAGSWRMWKNMASGRLELGRRPSTQIHTVGRVMKDIIAVVVPNRTLHMAESIDLMREHADREIKKSGFINNISQAGATLLAEYPGTEGSPTLTHMHQFMFDHVRMSADWVSRATKAAEEIRRGQKPVSLRQQRLFSF